MFLTVPSSNKEKISFFYVNIVHQLPFLLISEPAHRVCLVQSVPLKLKNTYTIMYVKFIEFTPFMLENMTG